MAPTTSDAFLWMGLAVLGWCSALAIHKQLTLIRLISEVPDSKFPPPDDIHQQTQDAIKISTLSELLHSTNPEIRDASVKIVVERALQSRAVWRLLRQQLRSTTDFRARDQALCILVQFGPMSTYDDRACRPELRNIESDEFFHPATFAAAVACLCNMLPAAREAENRRQHHDSAEADALWFVHKLMNKDVDLALKAGLVRNWLVDYPLTVQNPEKTMMETIQDRTTAYEYGDDYERLLCCVLYDLTEEAEGRRDMAKCGIGDPGPPSAAVKIHYGRHWGVRHQYDDPSVSEGRFGKRDYGGDASEDYEDDTAAAAMMDLERTHDHVLRGEVDFANLAGDNSTEVGLDFLDEHAPPLGRDERVVRRREESAEERALRSRRREAMVFAEGGGPIRREDIIESQRGDYMGEMVEEELEQLIEEVRDEVDGVTHERMGERQRTWLEYLVSLRPDGSVRG